MPLLKISNSHSPSTSGLQSYLESEKQCGANPLSCDLINVADRVGSGCKTWSRNMDETRRAAGTYRPYKGKKAITSKHCIIYPDPRDGISLATLQELVYNWASRLFGDYEVAIIYHSHGSVGLHAHVVINNTNLVTMGRLSSYMTYVVSHECYDELQRIALSLGLRAYASDHRSLTPTEFEAEHARIGRLAVISHATRADEGAPS